MSVVETWAPFTTKDGALGTLWIDETSMPITKFWMRGGLFHFEADATACWRQLTPGRTVARFHAPDGSLCGVGPFDLPEMPRGLDDGSHVALDVPMNIVGSNPGEEWWTLEADR